MAAHRFVLNAVVIEVQDFVDILTLHIHQVLHCVDIVLIPLQLETFFAPVDIEKQLALFARLEHVTIQ